MDTGLGMYYSKEKNPVYNSHKMWMRIDKYYRLDHMADIESSWG
jgi:ribosomal protein S24E